MPYKKIKKEISDAKSILYPGKYYLKEAHHAVHIYYRDLEKLVKKGEYKIEYESIKGVTQKIYGLPYTYVKVNTLKESLSRTMNFNSFEKRKATIKLKEQLQWQKPSNNLK